MGLINIVLGKINMKARKSKLAKQLFKNKEIGREILRKINTNDSQIKTEYGVFKSKQL